AGGREDAAVVGDAEAGGGRDAHRGDGRGASAGCRGGHGHRAGGPYGRGERHRARGDVHGGLDQKPCDLAPSGGGVLLREPDVAVRADGDAAEARAGGRRERVGRGAGVLLVEVAAGGRGADGGVALVG